MHKTLSSWGIMSQESIPSETDLSSQRIQHSHINEEDQNPPYTEWNGPEMQGFIPIAEINDPLAAYTSHLGNDSVELNFDTIAMHDFTDFDNMRYFE